MRSQRLRKRAEEGEKVPAAAATASRKGRGKRGAATSKKEKAPKKAKKEETEVKDNPIKDQKEEDEPMEEAKEEPKEEKVENEEKAASTADAPEQEKKEKDDDDAAAADHDGKKQDENQEAGTTKRDENAEKDNMKQDENQKEKQPTTTNFPDDFPTLKDSFGKDATVPLVGLLFAAGWCDDCVLRVPKVATVLKHADAPSTVTVFYVASDNTEEDMNKFLTRSSEATTDSADADGDDHKNKQLFQVIPFDNVDERHGLNRHFQTCPKKLMDDLGIQERKAGIPTLMLLNAKDATVVCQDAVPDVENVNEDMDPKEILKKWKGLVLSLGDDEKGGETEESSKKEE